MRIPRILGAIGFMALLSACATTSDLAPLPTQSIDAPPPPPPADKSAPLPTQPIDAPPPPPPPPSSGS